MNTPNENVLTPEKMREILWEKVVSGRLSETSYHATVAWYSAVYNPSAIPVVRIGVEVRPNLSGYQDRRGIVRTRVGTNLWGVLLDGDKTETDFTTNELTPLS